MIRLPGILFWVVLSAAGLYAEQSGITLTRSAQPNCWDVEAIVREVTRNAATDREKALALHRFGMAHFIHFDGPIEERGEYVTDPVKLIGVYGFALCGNNSNAMSALYNLAGLKARTRSMPGHSVAEVWFEDKWNYIDTDMFGYVFLADGKRIASVDELSANPELFLQQANPPDPFYPYDRKEDMAGVFRGARASKNYHPYASAHMMNLTLRAGETATLYYRPRDRYLLTQLREDIGIVYKDYWVRGPVRRGSLAWTDKPPAAYGNGLLEYQPDLRSAAFRLENPEVTGAVVRQDRQSPPLAAEAPNRLASVVVEVSSPWVIVGLQNDLTDFQDDSDAAVVSGLFWRAAREDENRILVSTDAGRTWKKVWENRHLGAVPFQLDLTRWVNGRYAYWVKFEWMDRQGSGRIGLEGLRLRTWVELSPMALPRLVRGRNTFCLATHPRRTFYNESYWHRGEDLPGQQLENLAPGAAPAYLRPRDPARPGILTFDLGPRGIVEEARISVRARALGGPPANVALVLHLSTDDGQTWRELERFRSHPEHDTDHMWFNHVIRRAALLGESSRVRLSVTGGGLEKVIANSAVRAEPRAASALRVTHIWREGAEERTSASLFPSGAAAKDYEVKVTGPELQNVALRLDSLAQEPAGDGKLAFEHVTIDPEGPLDVWLKAVGDLNGDGRPDLIAGGVTKGGLVWYENPGWKKHVIAATGAFSTDGEVVDMDGDGDLDVVAITTKQILWFENPNWTVHPIADIEVHDIEVADLDGDGRPDIVGRNQGAFRKLGGTALHILRMESPSTWKHRRLEIPDGEGILLADVDRDGDQDVVVERQWLENPGDILGGQWAFHEYGPGWSHPHTFIAAGDLNGDQRLDIVLVPSEKAGGAYRISWFEAPADPKAGPWREHIIDASVETVHHFVGVADFDLDGSADVATARMHQGKSPEISVYVNRGAGAKWDKQVVAPTSSHSMRIVDVDGDGRPDLYGANWRGHAIDLWRNVTPQSGAR